MSSSNTPAVNETTLYGQIPNYVVARPYYTVASTASAAVTSSAWAATNDAVQVSLLNNAVATLVALGYWATS